MVTVSRWRGWFIHSDPSTRRYVEAGGLQTARMTGLAWVVLLAPAVLLGAWFFRSLDLPAQVGGIVGGLVMWSAVMAGERSGGRRAVLPGYSGDVSTPRSTEERIAFARALFTATDADAWVATASADGKEHMVPLSVAWAGDTFVVVTPERTPTARNIRASGRARLGLGSTRDVVLVDVRLDAARTVANAPDHQLHAFATQAGWDPRADDATGDVGYVVLDLTPVQVLVWRDEAEIPGRVVMRDGRWIT